MFREILIDLLAEKGITQSDLAKLADIPKTTISGWMNAGRKPDYEALKKLALFFDVSTDYLLGLSEEETAIIYDYSKYRTNRLSPKLADSSKNPRSEIIRQLETLNDREAKAIQTILSGMQKKKLPQKTGIPTPAQPENDTNIKPSGKSDTGNDDHNL